jgi:hypothetical protein
MSAITTLAPASASVVAMPRPMPEAAAVTMDLMFRHGGSTSFKTASRLAEVWRDLQVVGQAATLAPEWYPMGGRAFLGLDPGPRLR